jgi:hypothetical protein
MAKTIKKSIPASASKVLPIWQRKFFNESLVFLFAFSLFINSIPNKYNLDDELVTINHRLTSKGVAAIPEIFTSPYYMDQSGYSYEYRPVVLASFAIEHQLFGDNPYVSHFFNVLLYALACLLLFQVLSLVLKNYSVLLPLGISLLFAAHPAHTEVVCGIKNRDEILGLLFSLLSLSFALKSLKAGRSWLILPVAILFMLALMSKVTVVSFALIIPLALILFTDADISILLGITSALLVPVYFLLNVSQGIEKILICIAIITTVLILHIIIHYKTVSLSFKSFFNKFYTLLFAKKQERDLVPEDSGIGFTQILSRIAPDKKIWAIYPLLINTTIAALYILGILTGHSLLSCIPISILLLLAWRGEESVSWWATFVICVCLTINILVETTNFKGPTSLNEWYSRFLALYLAYQAYYGPRGLFIPSMICFVFCVVFGRWESVFSLPIILLVFRYPRLILTIILILINGIMIYTRQERIIDIFDFVITIGVIASIHFNKYKSEFTLVLACVAFAIFHFTEIQTDKQIHIERTVSAISDVSNKVNPKLISESQNRPLNFMEVCVNSDSSHSVRVGTSLEILFHYIQKVVLPYPMSFYYGYKFIYPQKITDPVPLISMVIHFLLLIFAILLVRRFPIVSFGILIYIFSISVFSNYLEPIAGMIADRFLLIPSLGWIIVLVACWSKIFKIRGDSKISDWPALSSIAKYSILSVLLLYSYITFSRNFDWKNDLTLFRHDINYVSESSQAHNLLGVHIMKSVQDEPNPAKKIELEKEALSHLKKAVEIYPYFFNTTYDIGRVYMTLDMPDSAIAAFKHSLTLDTSFRDVYLNLGTLLIAQFKFNEALPYYESVIRLSPNEYIGYEQLSFTYFKMNQFNKSIEVNLKASRQLPNLPDPYINMGRTYIAQNRPDSALIYLNKANAINPGNASVQELLRQMGK